MMRESNNADSPTPTILVVEDFEDTRLLMKVWLSKKGYRIVEATDGQKALEVALRESPVDHHGCRNAGHGWVDCNAEHAPA